MIDVTGPYILVLLFHAATAGGIATHEMPSFESCQAAVVQLDPIRSVNGYCIAKNIREE